MSYLVDGVVATGAGAFHAGEISPSQSSSPLAAPYHETEPEDSTQEPVRSVQSSIPSASVGSLLDDDFAKEIEVGCFLFHLSRNLSLTVFVLDPCPISNSIKKTNPRRFRVTSTVIKEAAPSSG